MKFDEILWSGDHATARWISTLAGLFFTTVALAGTASATPSPVVITFDDDGYVHGSVINSATSADGGQSIQLRANNRQKDFNYAVTFDSEIQGSTGDPDLQAPWSGGNIQDEDLGLILIVQANDTGCDTGVCSNPVAEPGIPAGNLTFFLDTPASSFGLDLIDVADGEDGFIRFYPEDNWGGFVTIEFKDLLAGLDLGINYANRIAPLTAAEIGLEQISRVGVKFYESGAVDNLTFVPIPEPTTALMVGGGLLGLAFAQRSPRRKSSH
ncbi:MAG: PEP-CTERM sorting domain-containing protein [Myxococcota bacterium]|nr:PEP-CTERM sorting domain-containing protein [Myxococcota bacterium]